MQERALKGGIRVFVGIESQPISAPTVAITNVSATGTQVTIGFPVIRGRVHFARGELGRGGRR